MLGSTINGFIAGLSGRHNILTQAQAQLEIIIGGTIVADEPPGLN